MIQLTSLTLYEKVWDLHVVKDYSDGTSLLYVDRHLVQEVSSPQAFAGLIDTGRRIRRPDAQLAVADHAVPTTGRRVLVPVSPTSRQISQLVANCRTFNIPYIPSRDRRHGIAHVIGPELGFTLPGTVLVCGDSHTCTHGAFGALAFGIGASECECIFATQTIRQRKQGAMLVRFEGRRAPGVEVKDLILAFIAKIGVGGGTGYAIEFAGSAVANMSMEQRMTLCNMSIEAGSRVGMVAPDATTFDFVKQRPLAPNRDEWNAAMTFWQGLASDPGAGYQREVTIDVGPISPHVSWGTTPEECSPIDGKIPDPNQEPDASKRAHMRRSLAYMGLQPGTPLVDIRINKVFIGSCTNGRLEDLRSAAAVIAGRTIAKHVEAIVVPGSAPVREQAEAEGLDRIFLDAGFQWRSAGCSMCVAMNGDQLKKGEHCASTSNRNFEGRQGQGGRTHLLSPAMAAAAAIAGHLTDVRRDRASEAL